MYSQSNDPMIRRKYWMLKSVLFPHLAKKEVKKKEKTVRDKVEVDLEKNIKEIVVEEIDLSSNDAIEK